MSNWMTAMQVTAATKTADGTRYALNNGDALLMKESVSCGGRSCATYPVYEFANGRTYSALTGRHSQATIVPAMAAVRRYWALSALADRVAEAGGQQCPDCRSRDIEDNGQSGRWLEYRCVACDRRFGPGAEA